MTKQEFMSWFMHHYPEGSVIHNSGWHAARIYRASGSSPAQVAATPEPGGYCDSRIGCQCGGDTEGVRATCGNWKTS